MVLNFVNGKAGINALARLNRAQVKVVDMGVAGPGMDALAQSGRIISTSMGKGTANIAKGPAMTRETAIRCVEAGIQAGLDLAAETDVFGTGDMGIGNTTPSAAIVAAFTGSKPADVTGRGTGVDNAQWKHKVEVIARALKTNNPNASDGLDVLAKVGGFEIGGIAG